MIYGIAAKTGIGKTYLAVVLTKYYLEIGINVFSDFTIDERYLDLKPRFTWRRKLKNYIRRIGKPNLPPAKPMLGKLYYWKDLKDFRVVHSGVVIVDEAGGFFSSRAWKSLSNEDMTKFQQHRKEDLDIIYTIQNISRIDSSIRELTHFVYIPHRFFKLNWYKLYEPERINNLEKKGACLRTRYYWYNPRYERAFNTREMIHKDHEQVEIDKYFKRMATKVQEELPSAATANQSR